MIRNTLFVAMVASITVLAGCYSSGVERNWGRAQRISHTAQIKYPEAPGTLDAPTGLDAVTGETVSASHRKRAKQKTEQAVPPSLVSIGTGLGER